MKQNSTKPKIVIHNSISIDGSLTGFMPEMDLHYGIAARINHDARLIGSETIIKGIDLFGEGISKELPEDFSVPERDSTLPWWVIVDSGGKLKGMLHTCRRFEFCKDLIILISETTPDDYKRYLEKRNYNYLIAGPSKVDIPGALEQLMEKFKIVRILADTGRILGNILINLGLVSEISLLVHPLIIGSQGYNMFSDIQNNISLELIKSEQLEKGCVWLIYNLK